MKLDTDLTAASRGKGEEGRGRGKREGGRGKRQHERRK
jgi:hypothetical protein